MTAIPVKYATIRATERIRDVIKSYLEGELGAVESVEFPLPTPEQIITGRVTPDDAFRRLNIDEVGIWVTKQDVSREEATYSGDGEQNEVTWETPFQITLMVKDRPGFDYPTPPDWDRPMLSEEWMDRRAEMYKGAIIDTLTQHAVNQTAIHEINVQTNEADVVEVEQMGALASASVIFTVHQDILIKR